MTHGYRHLKMVKDIISFNFYTTSVKCTGNETATSQCNVSFDVTSECGTDLSSAGVICYNGTGMHVHLVLYDKMQKDFC